ncbi:hypothetical protein GF336_02265 [Candidatus Woesearchaeota archaeon]|nr:hypothetical protein [Candidatus Woesearchaeota archaeon]
MDAVEKAREIIGKYCYEECKASCCRRGMLVLDVSEAEVISMDPKPGKDGKVVFDLGKQKCPRLGEDKRCIVYDKRPKACRDFPFLVSGNKVIIAPLCPLGKDPKLDFIIDILRKGGYTII